MNQGLPDNKSRTFVGDVISDIGDRIEGVNIIKWGVIPGISVALVVLLFILFVIQPTFTGSSPTMVCNSVPNPQFPNNSSMNIKGNCKEEMVGNWWKILVTLGVSGMLGASAGLGCYKLGLAYYNPKAAAGIVGVSAFSNAMRGNLF